MNQGTTIDDQLPYGLHLYPYIVLIVDSVRTTNLPKEYTLLDGAGTPEARAILGLNLPTHSFWQVPKEPEETDGPETDKAHREGAAG